MSEILVVDDESSIREMILEFLGMSGLDATSASGGKEALARVASEPPKVILLDVAMPEMDGIETLKELRRKASDCAVIVMSGHADMQTAMEALELGACDFIQKPIDLRYLKRMLVAKLATLDDKAGNEAIKGS